MPRVSHNSASKIPQNIANTSAFSAVWREAVRRDLATPEMPIARRGCGRASAKTCAKIGASLCKPSIIRRPPPALILAEHDRGEPAGHQRHHRGDEAIADAAVARRVGDELLEADLGDLER